MDATAQSQREKEELEAVLASGIFNRAPNLAGFLSYVCEKHFQGQAEQIKEYNIAVDALGRPPEFDQKKDSIVRVEAHRLRKRLAEYYAAAGSGHALRIVIANGQYAPQFLPNLTVQTAPEIIPVRNPVTAIPPQPAPIVMVRRGSGRALTWTATVMAATFCVALLWSYEARKKNAAPPGTPETWKGNWTEPVSGEFRMLAGYHGSAFVDRQGHTWEPDAYYRGGMSFSLAASPRIEGLPDPSLPHSVREGGDFQYDIPVRPGTYELHLLFAEVAVGQALVSEGDQVRAFQVSANGQVLLDLYDTASEAGAPNRLQVRVFKDIRPAKDGQVHLRFGGQTGPPLLNALEILSSVPGKIRPIRLVARKTSLVDADGRVWAADEYVVGGHLVERLNSVLNMPQKNLFEGERFGNFSYRLPVVPGKYRIKLHFAETYFGTDIAGAPPLRKGIRVFNVFANGVALLRNFDIAEQAGGANRVVEKVFEGLEPNAQGSIILEFVPLNNYACVNAIEVEQME